MDDQRREEAPSETAQAWGSARRVREPVAWMLLALTVAGLLIGAWQLFGLHGAPVAAATLGFRAAAAAPLFVTLGVVTLPVLAVILVAFTGGLTGHARQVVQAAVSIQAVGLGLGALSWLFAFGVNLRPGVWYFVSDARDLAVAVVALIFTAAVRRSQALRPSAPRFQDFDEDDDDFADEDEDFAADEAHP